MLDYKVQAENKSLYNTPPVFGVYIMRLVMKWLLAQGGLEAIGRANAEKARDPLRRDRPSGGFYRAARAARTAART